MSSWKNKYRAWLRGAILQAVNRVVINRAVVRAIVSLSWLIWSGFVSETDFWVQPDLLLVFLFSSWRFCPGSPVSTSTQIQTSPGIPTILIQKVKFNKMMKSLSWNVVARLAWNLISPLNLLKINCSCTTPSLKQTNQKSLHLVLHVYSGSFWKDDSMRGCMNVSYIRD